MTMECPVWWDYAVFYPESDEEGYDGVHDGGVKCLTDNAPDEAVKAFNEYKKALKSGIKL